MSSGHTKLPTYGFDHKPVENKRFGKVNEPKKPKPSVLKSSLAKVKLKMRILALTMRIYIITIQIKRHGMLNWIKDRLEEPSTYQGITGLLATIGYAMNPEMLEFIITTAVGLISLIQMSKSEKLLTKKK
jgi:hypothetical protein